MTKVIGWFDFFNQEASSSGNVITKLHDTPLAFIFVYLQWFSVSELFIFLQGALQICCKLVVNAE